MRVARRTHISLASRDCLPSGTIALPSSSVSCDHDALHGCLRCAVHSLHAPRELSLGGAPIALGPRVGARRIQSLLGGPRQKLCTHGTALFWMRTLALPSGCRSPFIGILGTGRSEERRGCVTLTEIRDTQRAIPLPLSLYSQESLSINRRVLRCVFTVHARASVYEHASRSAHYRNNRARAACGAEVQFCKEGPLG